MSKEEFFAGIRKRAKELEKSGHRVWMTVHTHSAWKPKIKLEDIPEPPEIDEEELKLIEKEQDDKQETSSI